MILTVTAVEADPVDISTPGHPRTAIGRILVTARAGGTEVTIEWNRPEPVPQVGDQVTLTVGTGSDG